MSVNCMFHRSKAAHFHCYECGSAFCDECVSVRETEGYSGKDINYFCPGCNIPAEMMSLGNIIEPFWNRLNSIFLYPLQPTPLILTLVLAALGALLPMNIFVRIFVWVVMMKYAYATLIQTAQGGLKAPEVTWDLINQDIQQVFKQFIIFIAVGFCTTIAFQKAGLAGGYIFLVAIALAMPAIIMLLVSTNSVIHALNPYMFLRIIYRIGWPYLLMYLFLFFLMAGPATLFSFLPQDAIPFRLYVFLTLSFKQLYAIIGYHLMGYILLQYHTEIGYQVDYQFFIQNRGKRKKRKKQTPDDELKKALAVLVKTGRYKEAIREAKPHILGQQPDLEISEKYLQLLKMVGESEEALRYSVRHFELLAANNKKLKAIALFMEIKDGTAGPPQADSVFMVASWCQERNEFKKAIDTYVYFINQFKDHPLRPEVYFKLAKLLQEKTKYNAKAREILNVIIKSYPRHPLATKAKEYLARISGGLKSKVNTGT